MTAHVGGTAISASSQKSLLRAQLRRRRAGVPTPIRRTAARQAGAHLLRSRPCRNARRIAVYLEIASELPTAALRRALLAQGREIYVPKIDAGGSMSFVQLSPHTKLRRNRFGIAEPAGRQRRCPSNRLDLILLPLTGFDARGYRLGTGGGYYDRLLSLPRPHRRPRLWGFAYALQQVAEVPAEPWDIPLHAVCTERGIRFCR